MLFELKALEVSS